MACELSGRPVAEGAAQALGSASTSEDCLQLQLQLVLPAKVMQEARTRIPCEP